MSDKLFIWLARAFVLFTAMPIHESAHGFTAARLGDDTPQKQGRLTLNPLAHLDVLGSLLLIFAGFGWAKPVQVHAQNFKHPKRDMALTALAGPLSNVLLGLLTLIVYKILLQLWPVFRYQSSVLQSIFLILSVMITTNLYLAVFNLLPIPPLDGAKILGAVLPERHYFGLMRYERYIMLVVVALLFLDVLSTPLAFLSNHLIRFLDLLTAPLGRVF